MAQVINTNVAALFAGVSLARSAHELQVAQKRLSSGLRINSASDDAANLATSAQLGAKVRGANAAVIQANNQIAAAQTNDGYAAQIALNLQRLYEIAVAAGGTASGSEASALTAENSRLAALTAADGTAVVDVNGGTKAGIGTAVTAPTSMSAASILSDISTLSSTRAQYGADIAVWSSAVASLQAAAVNLAAQYSAITDTDYAVETAAAAKNNILQQAGTAALAQANQNTASVLTLLR